jgi:primosomal protein N' (replication factor Y)
VLGRPRPAAVIKGRYRFRLLVKSCAMSTCRSICANGSRRAKTKGNLKLEVDVDPQSFL